MDPLRQDLRHPGEVDGAPFDAAVDTAVDLAARLGAEVQRARRDLADLQAEFAALADPDVVALDDEHDSEGSTIGYERARVAGLIGRTEHRIADLESAIRRAAEGSYAMCDSCGGPIAAERLAALPTTRRCIHCARRC